MGGKLVLGNPGKKSWKNCSKKARGKKPQK